MKLPESRERVLAEIERFESALQQAQSGNRRPRLPLDEGPTGWRAVGGFILHVILAAVTRLTLAARLNRLARLAAMTRVRTDDLWYEPGACGVTSAYSDMGIALYRLGKTEAAIQCLDRAWHVFPCPHSAAFGLPQKLPQLLAARDLAAGQIAQYMAMHRSFRGSRTPPGTR